MAIVSTQVINEVCSVLMRKASFNERQIELAIDSFYCRCTVVELDRDTIIDLLHESALTLNPSPKLRRGTLKLAPLLPNLGEGAGG